MHSITIDGDLRRTLQSIQDAIELVDESGKRIGMFTPELGSDQLKGCITSEELFIRMYKRRSPLKHS